MKRISFLMMFMLCCSVNSAIGLEVTLQDCVDRALANNGELKSYKEDLVETREQVQISRAGLFPSLKLKGGYSLIDQPERLIINRDAFAAGIPPRDTEISTGDHAAYNLNLILTQPLFTGGGLTHAYRKSMHVSEETSRWVERHTRVLALDVQKAFHEALNAQLYTMIVEKAAEAKQERLRVLQELETEGYTGREEVLQQETDILFTDLEVFKGKNRKEIALSRLRNLIRYEGDDGPVLKGNSFNGTLTASLVEVREAALSNREELKASRSRIAAAEEDIAIARSRFYPQASLEGKFTQQKETNIARDQVWMLTAQLEWSLFEWGRTTSEVRQKVARRQKVTYEREELENSVRLEAEQAWRSLKEREKAVAAFKKRVTTEEFRLNLTADRYAEGKLKLAEVIEIEAQFIKAYNEYLTAINDLDVGLANLETAVALPLEKWLSSEEIYEPDVDSFEQKISELSVKKREAVPEDHPLKTDKIVADAGPVSTSAQPEATTDKGKHSAKLSAKKREAVPEDHPLKTDIIVAGAGPVTSSAQPKFTHDKGKHVAAVSNQASATHAHIAVQVGSFKERQVAYRHMKDISAKIRDRKIAIYPNGNFYKVRIAGFSSKKEAEGAMMMAGITKYLVLRKSDGR
jgi:outer membrane protein